MLLFQDSMLLREGVLVDGSGQLLVRAVLGREGVGVGWEGCVQDRLVLFVGLLLVRLLLHSGLVDSMPRLLLSVLEAWKGMRVTWQVVELVGVNEGMVLLGHSLVLLVMRVVFLGLVLFLLVLEMV